MAPSSPVHHRLSPRRSPGQQTSPRAAGGAGREHQISPPRKSSRPNPKDTFFDSPGSTSASAQEQRVIVPEVARKLECFRLREATSQVKSRKFSTPKDLEDALLKIPPFSESLRRALPSSLRQVPLPPDVQSSLSSFIDSLLLTTYPSSSGRPLAFKSLPPQIQARYIGLLERSFPRFAFCKSKGPKAHALAREVLMDMVDEARARMTTMTGKRNSVASEDTSQEISISLDVDDGKFGDFWINPAGTIETARVPSMPRVAEDDEEGAAGVEMEVQEVEPLRAAVREGGESLEEVREDRESVIAVLAEKSAELEAARREIGLLQRLSKTSEAVIRTLESKMLSLEAEEGEWRVAFENLNRKHGDLEYALTRLRRELARRDTAEATLLADNEQLKVELKATRAALSASLEEVLSLTPSRPASPDYEDDHDEGDQMSRSLSLIEEVSSMMERNSEAGDYEEGEHTIILEDGDNTVEEIEDEEPGNRTIDEYDFVEPGPSESNGPGKRPLKVRLLPKLGIKPRQRETNSRVDSDDVPTC